LVFHAKEIFSIESFSSISNRHHSASANAGNRKGGKNNAAREANEAAKLMRYETDPAAWPAALMAHSRQAMRYVSTLQKSCCPIGITTHELPLQHFWLGHRFYLCRSQWP